MNENNSSGGELLPAQSVNAIQPVRLHEHEGEPRVKDVDIAKRLGFDRPRNIRPLIERHRGALELLGPISLYRAAKSTAGRPDEGYWLNEAQALYIGSKSDAPNAPAVLIMLINVFMAWRRGHLPAVANTSLPADVMEMIRRDDGIARMLAHKVTGIEATVAAISNAVAILAERVVPGVSPASITRQGMTAGQIWRVNGFPPLRSTAWFGNRLTEMGCAIGGRRQLGDKQARLFDPDKAAEWLKGGGKAMVEGYVKERLGQGKLEGV